MWCDVWTSVEKRQLWLKSVEMKEDRVLFWHPSAENVSMDGKKNKH